MSISKLLDFAAFVVKQTRGQAIFALMFLLLSSITESISILLLIPLLQIMTPGSKTNAFLGMGLFNQFSFGWIPQISTLLIIFVILTLAQGTFNRFRTLYMAEMMQTAVDQVRTNLFIKIGSARWAAIVHHRESDLTLSLTTEVDRVQGAIYSLLQLIQNSIVLIIYIGVSTMISPKMTAFATCVGGVVFLCLFPLRRRASRHGRSLSESMRHRQQTLSQFLSGMKVAKAFNMEAAYFEKFRLTLSDIHRGMMEYANLGSISTFAFQVVSAIAGAAFIYFASEVAHISLPKIAVMLFLLMRIAPRFNLIQDSAQQLVSAVPAYEAVRALTATFEEQAENSAQVVERSLPPLQTGIRFENVSYGYVAGTKILNRVNLEIPAGDVTAIIGPSGSGKSTIADLVLGLLEPDEGRITVDGNVLDASTRRSWREQAAYVSQEVFLLNDTITANLSIGQPRAEDAEIWSALDAANAAEFVRRLPHGLDTVLGDRGVRLSGGERQRIALARALLRKPRLLLLDEATSALDWENQNMIAQSIEQLKGSLTVITIAHRASMIAFADRVIGIENGCVVEEGSYVKLMQLTSSNLYKLVKGESGQPGR